MPYEETISKYLKFINNIGSENKRTKITLGYLTIAHHIRPSFRITKINNEILLNLLKLLIFDFNGNCVLILLNISLIIEINKVKYVNKFFWDKNI